MALLSGNRWKRRWKEEVFTSCPAWQPGNRILLQQIKDPVSGWFWVWGMPAAFAVGDGLHIRRPFASTDFCAIPASNGNASYCSAPVVPYGGYFWTVRQVLTGSASVIYMVRIDPATGSYTDIKALRSTATAQTSLANLTAGLVSDGAGNIYIAIVDTFPGTVEQFVVKYNVGADTVTAVETIPGSVAQTVVGLGLKASTLYYTYQDVTSIPGSFIFRKVNTDGTSGATVWNAGNVFVASGYQGIHGSGSILYDETHSQLVDLGSTAEWWYSPMFIEDLATRRYFATQHLSSSFATGAYSVWEGATKKEGIISSSNFGQVGVYSGSPPIILPVDLNAPTIEGSTPIYFGTYGVISGPGTRWSLHSASASLRESV